MRSRGNTIGRAEATGGVMWTLSGGLRINDTETPFVQDKDKEGQSPRLRQFGAQR
jgi:hypothetical protein